MASRGWPVGLAIAATLTAAGGAAIVANRPERSARGTPAAHRIATSQPGVGSSRVPDENRIVSESGTIGTRPEVVLPTTEAESTPSGYALGAVVNAFEGEIFIFDPHLLADRTYFYASPDIDPSLGEAPAVAAGMPDTMEIDALVAADGVPTSPVVELTGKRRPELDAGVAVSLSGRVVEADGGAPVAGAWVVVTSTFHVRRYLYDHHLREVARVETDADGAWTIDRLNVDPLEFLGVRSGTLHLSVSAEGHAPALAVPLFGVTRGVANRLPDVALDRAVGVLRGRVLDMWEGEPVVGARVYVTGAIDPVVYPKDQRAALFVCAPSAITDEEGRFTIGGIGRGAQFVSAHGGDDCIGSEAVQIPSDKEFILRARQIRGRIEGTVVDGGGAPIDLVAIEGGENTTHSFADGRFTLENFRGDEVAITFSHPDFAPVVLETVKDGTAGLIVRMDRPRIRLVLVVNDGDTRVPVKEVVVLFTDFEPGTTGATMADTDPFRVSPNGRYSIRLPEKATRLSVSTHLPWTGREFDFPNSPQRKSASVDLAGRVDGEVVVVTLACETSASNEMQLFDPSTLESVNSDK